MDLCTKSAGFHLSSDGWTLSLWLRNRKKENFGGQTFFKTGEASENRVGFHIYQINGSFEHIAYRVISTIQVCTFIIPAPENIWSHFVFTWKLNISTEDVKIYINGKELTKFFYRGCKSGNFPVGNTKYVQLGDFKVLSLSPYVAFDDVIAWYKLLSSNDVKSMFHYYKG